MDHFALDSEAALIDRLLQNNEELNYVLPYPYTHRLWGQGQSTTHPFAFQPKLPVLCMEVVRGYEWKLWNNRRDLSAKLLNLRIARNVIIRSDGKPWTPNQVASLEGERMDSMMSSLMVRLIDSGRSGGIVDYQTNELIWATAQIRQTAGRGLPDMMLHSRNMSAMWEPAEEYRREQNLKERGALTDYVYSAYGWEQAQNTDLWTPDQPTPKQWVRVLRQFRASAMYMQQLDGRWCRMTEGVELIV